MKIVLGLFSYGGVLEGTVDCVLGELSFASQNEVQMMYHRISGDALIERSRSRALGQFMASDADVIVMIDHDITWRPGDACHIAEAALKSKALVGGLYCKRAFKRGWSSRIQADGAVEFGVANLLPTTALATGFLAIPRSVVEGMEEQLDITRPLWTEQFEKAVDANEYGKCAKLMDMSIAPIQDGAYRKVEFKYKDYFRCIRHASNTPDIYQFLSEDWSFSFRAAFCGYDSFISTYPVIGHTGDYRFMVSDGMDDRDLKEHGEKQENGTADNAHTEPGGDKGDVRNERNPNRRNRSKPAGASRKAGKRRKR